MTAEQLRRLNLYMLAIAIGAIVSGGGVLQHQLATTGEFDAAPIMAAMLGALITGLTTSVLPALKASADLATPPLPTPRASAPPAPSPPPTFAVIHRECGKTAFIALEPPTAFADLQASDALHIDGSPMVDGERIACDVCGAALVGIQAERGQWVAVSEPRGLGA